MLKSSTTTTQNEPRIAIVGHRGIPSGYGGFEAFADAITDRLVGFGCRVVVYCRSNYFKTKPKEYKGAALVYLPTVSRKSLDTIVHTFISVMHVIFKNTADVVLMVNVGNAPFALLAKLFGKKVIFCVDGLDWERKKWGAFARSYLKMCSYFAKRAAHVVVTDAGSVQEFYKTRRGTDSVLLPYGTDIEASEDDCSLLRSEGLEDKKYFVYVARLEPENNPLMVIRAYVASGSTMPLVIMGDNRYNPAFVDELKAAANGNVKFLGFVFGTRYKTIARHALAFIRAAEVGGISPAVIEAMGRGTCVIANDKPENREPLADTGIFYPLNEQALTRAIVRVSANPGEAVDLGRRALERAALEYSWETISYEFYKLAKRLLNASKVSARSTRSLPHTGTKRVLITGAGGMLGSALYHHFAKEHNVLALSRTVTDPWVTQFDVLNVNEFEKAVASFRPDYILHAMAMTNLEECDKNLSKAYASNTLAVKHAAQLATRYGAQFVYFSSGSVFDGNKKIYTETDEPNPIHVYGLTKHMGSLMAKYYAPGHLEIRLGWLIGGGPRKDKKFVARVVEQLVAGKKEIHAARDKFGTPSYAPDVARQVELLIKKRASGLYNVANTGIAARFDIAKEIVRILGYSESVQVHAVDSSYFADTFTANRGASESLENTRLNVEGRSRMRPWQEALEEYLKNDFEYAQPAEGSSFAASLVVDQVP